MNIETSKGTLTAEVAGDNVKHITATLDGAYTWEIKNAPVDDVLRRIYYVGGWPIRADGFGLIYMNNFPDRLELIYPDGTPGGFAAIELTSAGKAQFQMMLESVYLLPDAE